MALPLVSSLIYRKTNTRNASNMNSKNLSTLTIIFNCFIYLPVPGEVGLPVFPLRRKKRNEEILRESRQEEENEKEIMKESMIFKLVLLKRN